MANPVIGGEERMKREKATEKSVANTAPKGGSKGKSKIPVGKKPKLKTR